MGTGVTEQALDTYVNFIKSHLIGLNNFTETSNIKDFIDTYIFTKHLRDNLKATFS